MKELTVKLDDCLYEKITNEAKRQGTSVDEILAGLIKCSSSIEFLSDFLDKLEAAANKEYSETIAFRNTRILSEEGVPVFLLLDDMSGEKKDQGLQKPAASDEAMNLFFSLLSALYLKCRIGESGTVESSDIGEVAGSLADRYFANLKYEEWRKG